MKNSNNVRKILIGAILLLPITPVLSQKASIDTINKKVTLDSKAVIATGNLLRQGSEYKDLFNSQKVLVDSLFYLSEVHKQEINEFRNNIVPTLEDLNKEQKKELLAVDQKCGFDKELLNVKLKKEKRNKWKFAGAGILTGIIMSLLVLK